MGRLMMTGLGILLLMGGQAWAQDSLGLAAYLSQVKEKGPEYRSAQKALEGYSKQSRQQDLTFSPTLDVSYGHMDDQQEQLIPFNGDRTQADELKASLSNQLPWGPKLSVGYSFRHITVSNSPFILSPYYSVAPTASISLPLFKDFLGAQTRAGADKVRFQFESAAQGAGFQAGGALFNAKVAYWNLALLRAEKGIRQDTLERSQKIWEWTKRRVARNLADPPDALQAEASVRVAELDLQMAEERERTARLDFNRLRGLEQDGVPEGLEGLEASLSSVRVEIPAQVPDRQDLLSSERTAAGQKAAYDEAHQNIFPDITLMASWTGGSLDGGTSLTPGDLGIANSEAFQNKNPVYQVGAKFSLPLDVFTASRVSEGYQANSESARLAYEDKRIEVAQQWKDLRDRLKDADKRLEMASQIETIQRKKADEERRRLELGRTTQFQLLSFENDYALARLRRLSLVLEKLSLLAQAQWWLASEK